MHIRRRREADSGKVLHEEMLESSWHTATSWPDFGRLQDIHDLANSDGLMLPFQPLSFRDFMLFESHGINSARGYVRRFMPLAYPVVWAWDKVFRRPLPALRPSALWYHQPTYYMSNHLAFVPSGTPIACPSYSNALDYELELGFVITKPLYNPTPEEALEAIGAFVVVCDFSARDVQRPEMQSGFGPQKSKHFVNSMSCTAVSADSILPAVDCLRARVIINGSVVWETSTAGMQYSLQEVICHAAKDEHVYPGELLATGTLPGACALENGHWLKAGDTVRLEIDGVSHLEHKITR